MSKQTTQLINNVGNIENAKIKQQAILGRYQTLLNLAENKLKATNDEASSINEKMEAVRIFSDWLADQRPILAGFLDPTGNISEIAESIDSLRKMISEQIPRGDKSCEQIESQSETEVHPIVEEWANIKGQMTVRDEHCVLVKK